MSASEAYGALASQPVEATPTTCQSHRMHHMPDLRSRLHNVRGPCGSWRIALALAVVAIGLLFASTSFARRPLGDSHTVLPAGTSAVVHHQAVGVVRAISDGDSCHVLNVIDITTRSARAPEPAAEEEGARSAEEQGAPTPVLAGDTPSKVGTLLWSIVRVPLFLVLYWLRLPVMLVCRLISVPALLAFLFSLYAFPDRHAMVTGFGVLSFGAFAALWLYDTLLMWLSPQDMMCTL